MDFVSKRKWYYLLSALIIIPGIISLLIPPRLYLGIDFTGGSTLDVKFASPVPEAQVRDVLSAQGHSEAVVQPSGASSFFIRTTALREADAQAGIRSEREVIREAFEKLGTSVERLDVDFVSGVVAASTVRNAFYAVVAASVAMLLYIWWAFRQVPNPFRYGLAAIVALLHDVFVVLGVFSIMGKLFRLEVDTMFLSGLLTVIGYSVNDTIVVFDRIRENVARLPAERLERNVNTAIMETMGRSILTGFATILTILALLFLGGASTRNFLLVLLIGIVSGTYSSIFNASQILVSWERGELAGALRRLRLLPARRQA